MKKLATPVLLSFFAFATLFSCDAGDIQTDFKASIPTYVPVKELVFQSIKRRSQPLPYECAVGVFNIDANFEDLLLRHARVASSYRDYWERTPFFGYSTDTGASGQLMSCASARLALAPDYSKVFERYGCCEYSGYVSFNGYWASSHVGLILVYAPKQSLLFVIARTK